MAKIKNHMIMIQTNAKKYAEKLKKIIGHMKFTASCKAQETSAGFLRLEPDVKTRYAEIPIRIKRTVQTIGKSQPGGERGGFFRTSKFFMLPLVSNPEITPVPRLISKLTIRGFNFMECILYKIHQTFQKNLLRRRYIIGW